MSAQVKTRERGWPVNLPARLSAAAILAAIASSASADIILLEQSRELLVRAEDPASPFVEQRSSSTSTGWFTDSISVMAGSHWGAAAMDSFIGPDLIYAASTTEGGGDYGFPMGQGMGEATVFARFEVAESIPFRLTGHFAANGSDAGGGVSLAGPSGQVLGMAAPAGWTGVEYLDESGMLDPGIYTLNINVAASVFSPPGADGSFDVRFQLPAPGAIVVLAAGFGLMTRRQR